MDIQEQVKNGFLKDVEQHIMTKHRDAGVHRSVHFGRPGSSMYHFRLATWPGHLCISGGMGCYVFSRTSDMFEFFRTGIREEKITINPGYWAEKCVAVDRTDGLERYSPDKLIEHVKDYACEHFGVDSFEKLKLELQEAIRNEVIEHAQDETSEHLAIRAAMDFRWGPEFPFQDFWEVHCRVYTYRYLWCLHAIVWGIREYDKASVAAGR